MRSASAPTAPNPQLDELVATLHRLRAPGGCAWDRDQTHASLVQYLVEETYELIEAIESGGREELIEELGDVLYQVLFHADIEAEAGSFTLEDVAAHMTAKMIARHPHVFGERKDLDAQGVLRQWEAGKQREAGHASILGKSPAGLPALLRAYRVQEKAASVGFDWPDVAGVLAKIREEVDETESALAKQDAAHVAEEIGDLLFAVVNLARFVRTDPEAHLRAAIEKFRRRFDRMVEGLNREGTSPERATLDEMDRLWEEAKREERKD